MRDIVREYLTRTMIDPEEVLDDQRTMFVKQMAGGTIIAPIDTVTTTWIIDADHRRYGVFSQFEPTVYSPKIFEIINRYNQEIFYGAWMVLPSDEPNLYRVGIRHGLQLRETEDLTSNLVEALTEVHMLIIREEGPKLLTELQAAIPSKSHLH